MCKRVVFDIETDALLADCTVVHCLVIRDLDDDSLVTEYFGPEIFSGLRELENADEVWGHYAAFFDIPALRKLYPDFRIDNAKVFDSVLAAQLAFPTIEKDDYSRHVPDGMPKRLVGSHSLEAWGWRLGSLKVGLNVSFKELTPELLARCVQDTAVTVDVIRQCQSAGIAPVAWKIESALAWFLSSMEKNGFHFDVEAAHRLVGTLRGKQMALREELTEWGGSWRAEAGKPFVPKRNNAKLGYVKGVPVQKYKTVFFNPNSRQHIIKLLKEQYQWEPTEWTDEEGKNPRLDEAVLKPLSHAMLEDQVTPRFPVVAKLLEHFEVGKQLGYVADGSVAWLDLVSDGKIHGHINQMGTDYVRASHSRPNLGQVPKEKEFRSLFYVPERIAGAPWSLVGVDMSGIELRMLAHYTTPHDGGEYARIILGGDPHTANAQAWGVPRDRAKTGIYALIYGAGDKKLGRTLFPHLVTELDHKLAGRKARNDIMSAFVGLGGLIESVRRKAGSQGYLTALDGRRLPVRSDYAALNNVLQSAAAVCAKQWLVNVDTMLTRGLGPQGWDGGWAAQMWVHDELQVGCQTAHAETVRDTMIWGIEEAGRQFAIRVPLTGAGKIGHNWSETH